eukprot:38836-Eustigmatos_ZCMA.PRE.1
MQLEEVTEQKILSVLPDKERRQVSSVQSAPTWTVAPSRRRVLPSVRVAYVFYLSCADEDGATPQSCQPRGGCTGGARAGR